MPDDRRIINPQCHEYSANYNYNQHGLRPWFACDRAVKDGGGKKKAVCDALGDTWNLTLYYQDSGTLPPEDGLTPAGTLIQQDTIREFRISAVAVDDTQQRKANFHIRPRWHEMVAENNDGQRVNIPVPEQLANSHTDAVNVRINGSNINFDNYGALLRTAADALDINPDYFDTDARHRTSNVQDAARYVRIHTDVSGPVHGRTGPIVGLAHVLENDREGYRKLVQNDTDEEGRRLPGYYHTATLGPDRVREVMPNHQLPVECKHYYAKDAHGRNHTDPLAHPKLEVAYQTSRWNDTLRPDDLDELETELDEWLYAILNDAGLSLRAGGSTYVDDAYFQAENQLTSAAIVSLDLTEVRHEQESIVYKHLADGLSPVEQDTLGKLVTDGGHVSAQDIAEDTDRHRDSIYAALKRMNDLVEHQYGSVSLKSTYVSELVADALERAQDAVTQATVAHAEAREAERRGLDERTSAFLAWCQKYGIDCDEGRDRMEIELGHVSGHDEVRRLLREGQDLWRDMKRDAIAFREARVRWSQPDSNYSPRFDDPSERRRQCIGTAWQLLR